MNKKKFKVHSKHNWPKLKNEFFRSEFLGVEAWVRSKFGSKSGGTGKNVVGWTEDKKKYLEEKAARDLEATEKVDREFKVKTLKKILDKIELALETKQNIYALQAAWMVFRTECGLPTSISKLTSANLNQIINTPLTDKQLADLGAVLNDLGIEKRPSNSTIEG